MRIDGRKADELRQITIEPGFAKYAEGSSLVTWGNTKVICTASWEPKVAPWLKDLGQGWVTAEYAMIPRCAPQRIQRDIIKKQQAARSVEIQRLIGRALRSAVDMKLLGENTITIDCDVIQADGGTRVASTVGGFVALVQAIRNLKLKPFSIKNYLGAVSLGMVNGELLLDLNYEEDSKAQVDMNLISDADGNLSEVQATGETSTIPLKKFNEMMELGMYGILQVIEKIKEAIGPIR
jgi:ribonuclease PH